MLDLFFLAGLPYVAVFTMVVGSIYRFNSNRFSYSALSSQFLENDKVFWGSLPWHLGLGIVFFGHLIAFLFPRFWQDLASGGTMVILIEITGLAAAVACFIGLLVLFIRRLFTSRIQAVTSTMDLVILLLLLVQIVLGILTAVLYPWGSSWAPGTMSPYLWSLVSFSPNIAFVENLPIIVKLHLIFAWVIVLLIPFSRLVHAFSLPFRYFTRPPQVVIWNRRK